MDNFMIDLDSEFARELGFTSDKFQGYLWKKDDVIYVSFIISKEESKGHLRELFSNIHKNGLTVRVPTPFARMENICKKLGFKKIIEHDDQFGPVEIMELSG